MIWRKNKEVKNDLYGMFEGTSTSVGVVDIPTSSTDNRIEKEIDIITVVKSTVCSIPSDLPKEGALKYPPLEVGQSVYGMRFSLKQPWYKCKIKTIINNSIIEVWFDEKDTQLLTKREIAFTSESPVRFPVGSRVIAKFCDHDTIVVNYYYAGIIAEPPKIINEFR